MVAIFKSATFDRWLRKLPDYRAIARIEMRIRRLSLGNPGDVSALGHGLSELRVDYGPGYRLYFMQRGSSTVILLCGGDKRTQQADIGKARRIAAQWKD
jgi:putative addiction module killer protein